MTIHDIILHFNSISIVDWIWIGIFAIIVLFSSNFFWGRRNKPWKPYDQTIRPQPKKFGGHGSEFRLLVHRLLNTEGSYELISIVRKELTELFALHSGFSVSQFQTLRSDLDELQKYVHDEEIQMLLKMPDLWRSFFVSSEAPFFERVFGRTKDNRKTLLEALLNVIQKAEREILIRGN